ncbi:COR domain-containing protein [Leptolyngbya iicbica]|uniref:non-specific serine/threonine protein kinase n=2 Tax=Cyanophyceae TaxID=3028117 RepID=A0A4Q7EHQ6_9CYAN|nr:COR domain-containing protein [Leptolyngbya sp. LK]RZM82905.1 TIR domain-containing protein [Leptolyngbya sp. LK]
MTQDELLQIIEKAAAEGATKLDLRENQLSSLPPELGQLQNLSALDLRSNQLSSLPPELGQLQNLLTLDLRSNPLSSLPPELGQLQNLSVLYLSSNQLSSLPPELGQLQNLSLLDLRENPLSSLPPELGQLQNLSWLDLRSNQLSSLPPELGQLQNLLRLYLSGNPLPIPPEILIQSSQPQAIFDFYFAIQDPSETDRLYEAKFLIVGEGGAGKTSLAKKIQDPNYKLNPDEDSTHGIDVIQWRFPLDDGQDFRVNIWDFGGQEIYHQTHQFFLTERSLYALVADTRKENTDFPYWLNSIELFGGDSPVLMIKNEKGNRPCNVNEKQLRGDFQYIQEFLPTNLQDGRGLDAIKTAIQYYVTRLDFVGMPWPKTWSQIREALEQDDRDFMSQHDYFALCDRNGVTDRTEMLRISDFLHQLGICLHFQKDRVLKHLVILRPEWATNAVYAIVKNDTVAAAKGLFTRTDAETIWAEANYANLGDELLQLMENFNLCYPIPGLPDAYIAPQLLDFEPPPYDWEATNALTLRYEYEFMPKGILTQLIVRLYRWIEQQQLVWRSGVVLTNGRARAEVIETYRPYKGEIRLCISGLHSKELLSIVANELDQINDSFEKIKVSKKIPCNCEDCLEDREPHYFRLQTLDRFLAKGRTDVTCEKSALDVPIRSLTAVIPTGELFADLRDRYEQAELLPGLEKQATQDKFDRLKQQHTEYYPANQFYDVFLAHNSQDKPFVRQVYQQLKKTGLQPWLDEEDIAPGTLFQDEIQKIIQQTKTAAIFIGPTGLGPWQNVEQRAFISQCVSREIRVIPVLLPGVHAIPEELIFLQEFGFVSFETNDDETAIDRLRWGITREKS